MIAPEKNANPAKGIMLVIIAFLGFSAMSAFVKECSLAGLKTQEVMFFQNLVALIVILPWIFRDRKHSLRPQNMLLVSGRTIVGLLSMYFYFLAVKLIPLVDATLLQSTTPLFIPVIAWFVFRKKVTVKTLVVMMSGFVGVAMVLHPGKGALNAGDLIALLSGFLSALSTVFIKILDDKEEPVKVVMFYYLAVTTAIMGVWAMPTWVNPHGRLWLYLVSSGVLYALFQMLLILSVKYASTTTISPFIYLAVVFAGTIDWLVWNEIPTLLTVLGSLVVIASAIMSTIHLRHHRFPMHHR